MSVDVLNEPCPVCFGLLSASFPLTFWTIPAVSNCFVEIWWCQKWCELWFFVVHFFPLARSSSLTFGLGELTLRPPFLKYSKQLVPRKKDKATVLVLCGYRALRTWGDLHGVSVQSTLRWRRRQARKQKVWMNEYKRHLVCDIVIHAISFLSWFQKRMSWYNFFNFPMPCLHPSFHLTAKANCRSTDNCFLFGCSAALITVFRSWPYFGPQSCTVSWSSRTWLANIWQTSNSPSVPIIWLLSQLCSCQCPLKVTSSCLQKA